mmetsp:Transcript_29499/g.44831  ORF Transcript_29499/g.44831 Transcript_29499/m.44831 type:complete len:194 (-) Transcript_29499:48-629(-)
MSSYITKPSQGKAFVNNIRSVASKNKDMVDSEQMEELKEAFQLFDTNHTGNIDSREFKAAMRALGFPIKKIDVIRYFKEIPKDISESLTFEEFVRIVGPIMPKRDSKEEVFKIFQLFDEDKTGKISFKNLKKIAGEVGENLNDEEIKEMIGEADRSLHKEGLIDFEDFFRIMKKNCDDPLGEFDSDEDDEGVY